jgi:2-oxoglutarate dehydrogenase E1 component
MDHPAASILPNADLFDQMYQRWARSPGSVDPGWQAFFQGFELGLARSPSQAASVAPGPDNQAYRQIGITRLIINYREMGHQIAANNPLLPPPEQHPLYELSQFLLATDDPSRVIDTAPFVGLGRASIAELVQALRDTYCRSVGAEYMHIQDIDIRHWLQERMEPCRNRPTYDNARRARLFQDVCRAEELEKFIQRTYSGQKRFSLEGAESLIPLLETLVEAAAEAGVREIILGMPHRGRLNVLAHTLHKPYEEIFAQFETGYLPDSDDGDGDVKYHLGASADRVTLRNRHIHLSLTPNPSHLEAVNPVVEGRTRAKQAKFHDSSRKLGLPVLLHGDAAFAGQGLVPETLQLSQLEGYATGGTVHIVVNNQVGFTTNPRDARSTRYCTDVAKMIQAPIFHVNGDDPEAVAFVTELALAFRQHWQRDVVIDLVCYRRLGHNETDEPAFTQPLMYRAIRSRETLPNLYGRKLVEEGVLAPGEPEAFRAQLAAHLLTVTEGVRRGERSYPLMRGYQGIWKSLKADYSHAVVPTGVSEEVLRQVADGLTRLPEGFAANPKVLAVLQGWRDAVHKGGLLDWGGAETMAYGSLVLAKAPVRLSGQDCRRGTFSHRHAALVDQNNESRWVPLDCLSPDQARFEVYDSPLSEAAVLGFEFGYAMDSPHALVLWEAQYGDFVNGAMVIIDQFLASCDSKWRRDSGVVLLLPHGFEGGGPEHSSARLERFLQLCAEDNMQVCIPTTAAQHFHLLRRQVLRDFRKPLVALTPKSGLRADYIKSPVAELTRGHFREVLGEPGVDPSSVRRLILCSGKVYHDLARERAEKGIDGVALVRLEQLYPWPQAQLEEELRRYPRGVEMVWVQEEPHNNGAWFFVEPRLRAMGLSLFEVCRDESASPATGSTTVHALEQKELVEKAFTADRRHLVRARAYRTTRSLDAMAPQGQAAPSSHALPQGGGMTT